MRIFGTVRHHTWFPAAGRLMQRLQLCIAIGTCKSALQLFAKGPVLYAKGSPRSCKCPVGRAKTGIVAKTGRPPLDFFANEKYNNL